MLASAPETCDFRDLRRTFCDFFIYAVIFVIYSDFCDFYSDFCDLQPTSLVVKLLAIGL